MPLPVVRKTNILIRLAHAGLLRLSPYRLIPLYIQLSDMFLSLANLLVTRQHGGIHPKHAIMQYELFFLRFIEPHMTVLDVGSNRGVVSVKLAERARHVTGVEIEAELVQIARAHNSRHNVDYLHADVTQFSPDTKYDVSVLSNVLEHIDDRVGFLRALHTASEILLIRVPAMDRDWWPYYRRQIGLEWRSDTTHFIEYDEAGLRQELAAADWQIDFMERRWGEFYLKCRPGKADMV